MSTTHATKPVELTAVELNLLGAMLEAPVLAGVPDPFFGLLADEIEVALGEARDSLKARGILAERGEGEPPVVHLSVALMVGALCFPQVSLCLATLPAGAGAAAVTWFHLTRNLGVSVEALGRPVVCTLVAYPGPEAVLAAVLERLMPSGELPAGFRASLEVAGVPGSALQVSAAEGLLTEAPGGVLRQEASPALVEAAARALVERAWPQKEAGA